MTIANTAYVCKVNVNKIEIAQPDVVAELIELIKTKANQIDFHLRFSASQQVPSCIVVRHDTVS